MSAQKRKGSSEEATAAEWNKIFASYVSNKRRITISKIKKIYYENGWSNPTRVAVVFSWLLSLASVKLQKTYIVPLLSNTQIFKKWGSQDMDLSQTFRTF